MWPPSFERGSQGAGAPRDAFRLAAALLGAGLVLGDLKHAEALVLLQQLVLGPHLLSEAVELLLLLLGAHVDAGHGADELPQLLELGFEGVQVLVEIRAVLVHAFDDIVNQRQKGVMTCCWGLMFSLNSRKPKFVIS